MSEEQTLRSKDIRCPFNTGDDGRASEHPSGTPRQCISVCPWKLAQPIAGYRDDPYPQRHKKAACSFSYLFCCAGALCNMLEFLFIFVKSQVKLLIPLMRFAFLSCCRCIRAVVWM